MDEIKTIDLDVKSFDIENAICANCQSNISDFKLYYITFDGSYKQLIPKLQIPICNKCLKKHGIIDENEKLKDDNNEYKKFYEYISRKMNEINKEYINYFRRI